MTDKDYIDRGALQEIVHTRIKALYELYGAYDAYGSGYEECAETISEMPAADVVEVVRCKDCKNAYINSFSAQSGVAVCRFLANRSNGELAIVQQDDYCSYGERKEERDG